MLRVEAATRVGSLNLDVAIEVGAGECLALAGPSGAGKTSVLRVAAGLLRPARGRVTCEDDVWLDTGLGRELPPEQRRCGYLFQEYALFPHMNAWQNVAYPLRDLGRAERHGRAKELLGRFGLEAKAEERPRTLSGGERQRVALARALARRPRVLLLDEPLSALDARTRAAAARELAAVLRHADAPALLVTHDFDQAAQLGDRVGVIDSGRVVQMGSPSELAARPASAFVADFTGAVVLTGRAEPGPSGLTTVQLDGGGVATSVDPGEGAVAVSVYPWEIAIEPAAADERPGSVQNRLPMTIVSLTHVGNRVRVGLAGPQPLAAEVTGLAAAELDLRTGDRVTASWKASATRIVAV